MQKTLVSVRLSYISDFFGKRGVLVGEDEHIFNYITSPNVDDTNCDIVLESILNAAKTFEQFNVSKEVFRQTFIPKTMVEVRDSRVKIMSPIISSNYTE